jgi:hypothetical protein
MSEVTVTFKKRWRAFDKGQELLVGASVAKVWEKLGVAKRKQVDAPKLDKRIGRPRHDKGVKVT